MKTNIKFIFILLAGILAACDPYEDIVEEIEVASQSVLEERTVVLTDDDYDLLEDVEGAENIARFGNFSSDEDVRQFIPVILDAKFPYLANGSAATVTYDFFNGSSPDIRGDQEIFTVTDQEYEDLGFSFGNFSDLEEDVALYADFKVGTGSDGDYIDVTHDYWTGSEVVTLTTRVVWVVSNNAWMWAEPLPDDSYADFFGESPPDFSFEDEGEDNIPFWLKETKVFAVEGDQSLIQWNWDDGPGTSQSVALFIYTGGEWIEYGDVAQTTQESLQFGKSNNTWEPDNTIRYTLNTDDWNTIGNAWADRNPPGSASVLQFGNFDVGLWTEEQRFQAITEQLLIIFPSTEEGQKYLISYATWEPGSGIRELSVIFENGEYIIFEG